MSNIRQEITLSKKQVAPKTQATEPKLDVVKKARDRSGEDERSQLSLFHTAHDIKDLRDSGQMNEIWLVAQALILCGLPYDEVEDTQWEKKARLADGSELTVTFSAMKKGVPLPFGQDRGPLYFMVDRALAERRRLQKQIDSNVALAMTADLTEAERALRMEKRAKILDAARFVKWSKASEYLEVTGQQSGGKQYVQLRERMRRISYCGISIERARPNGSEESLVLPIIRSKRVPAWLNSESASSDSTELSLKGSEREPAGFEIGPDFFLDVVEHHVPISAAVIQSLLRRPKILDLVMWLCWRSFAAKTDTFIPIDDLRQQLGSTDSNDGRLLAHLRTAIVFLHQAGWDALRAEVIASPRGQTRKGKPNRNGLKIGPPKKGVHFNQVTEKAVKLHRPKGFPELES